MLEGGQAVVGDVGNRGHAQADDLGRRMAGIVGDGDGELVGTKVVGGRGVDPGTGCRVDAGRAVRRIAGDAEIAAIGEAVSIAGCQGAAEGGVFVTRACGVTAKDGGVVDGADADRDGGSFADAAAGNGVGVAVCPVEVGVGGVGDGAQRGVDDADGAVVPLSDGGDDRGALEAVGAGAVAAGDQVGGEGGVFGGGQSVIRNITHRADIHRHGCRSGNRAAIAHGVTEGRRAIEISRRCEGHRPVSIEYRRPTAATGDGGNGQSRAFRIGIVTEQTRGRDRDRRVFDSRCRICRDHRHVVGAGDGDCHRVGIGCQRGIGRFNGVGQNQRLTLAEEIKRTVAARAGGERPGDRAACCRIRCQCASGHAQHCLELIVGQRIGASKSAARRYAVHRHGCGIADIGVSDGHRAAGCKRGIGFGERGGIRAVADHRRIIGASNDDVEIFGIGISAIENADWIAHGQGFARREKIQIRRGRVIRP